MSCVCVASRPRGKRAARWALAAWTSSTRPPPAPRVAAHLVQRRQARVAVERRVLHALRHHRAGRLLEAHRERRLVLVGGVDQRASSPAPAGRPPPPPAGRARRSRRRPAPRRCGTPGSAATASAIPGSSTSSRSRCTSGWKVVCASITFASRASSSNVAPLPGDLRVQGGQRPLARRVDEQAGGVGHELVAHRALDRPVRAAPRRAPGSSPPTRARRRARGASRGRRSGRPGRRGGRSAGRPPRPPRPAAAPGRG